MSLPLNHDLWITLCSEYLTIHQVLKMRQVCKQLRDIVDRSCNIWSGDKPLPMCRVNEYSKEMWKILQKRQITKVKCQSVCMEEAGLLVSYLPQLQSLTFQVALSDKDIKTLTFFLSFLSKLNQVWMPYFGKSAFAPDLLNALGKCSNLTDISLAILHQLQWNVSLRTALKSLGKLKIKTFRLSFRCQNPQHKQVIAELLTDWKPYLQRLAISNGNMQLSVTKYDDQYESALNAVAPSLKSLQLMAPKLPNLSANVQYSNLTEICIVCDTTRRVNREVWNKLCRQLVSLKYLHCYMWLGMYDATAFPQSNKVFLPPKLISFYGGGAVGLDLVAACVGRNLRFLCINSLITSNAETFCNFLRDNFPNLEKLRIRDISGNTLPTSASFLALKRLKFLRSLFLPESVEGIHLENVLPRNVSISYHARGMRGPNLKPGLSNNFHMCYLK